MKSLYYAEKFLFTYNSIDDKIPNSGYDIEEFQ